MKVPDPSLVYDLEVRVIDLEQKVAALENALRGLSTGRKTDGPAAYAPLPDSVLKLIKGGEHPVRAIRQFRLLTQKELGESCGIRANHISAIERGMSYGLKTARRLAHALQVPVDLLT